MSPPPPDTRRTATLRIQCPDRRGLVVAVSEFLLHHGANLVHSDQHTDSAAGMFLQRVEWELDGFELALDVFAEAFRPVAERFEMSWELSASGQTPRIAILVSNQGHCLVDLLGRWRLGELRAEIPLNLSDCARSMRNCSACAERWVFYKGDCWSWKTTLLITMN